MEAAARVVDEHVDPVERRDPRVHRVGVAHVEQLGVRVPARGRDLVRGARQTVGVAVADRDVGAEARERRSRSAAPMPCAAPVTTARRPVSRTESGVIGIGRGG